MFALLTWQLSPFALVDSVFKQLVEVVVLLVVVLASQE
jgi:hypothetical protein